MPASTGDDQLMEVAVADDQVSQPAAVDVAALGGQGEQGGVDQELFIQVAVAAGGVVQIRPGPHVYVLAVGDRDIADVRGDSEDILMQITHRSSIPVLPVAGLKGNPTVAGMWGGVRSGIAPGQ